MSSYLLETQVLSAMQSHLLSQLILFEDYFAQQWRTPVHSLVTKTDALSR